jgi:hypothetical protein
LETLRANHFRQEYTGMDASLEHIRRAREKYPRLLSTGDACALSFPDRSYSFVFENNVFPFLLDPEKAVREMGRVSKRLVYFCAHATPIQRGGVLLAADLHHRDRRERRRRHRALHPARKHASGFPSCPGHAERDAENEKMAGKNRLVQGSEVFHRAGSPGAAHRKDGCAGFGKACFKNDGLCAIMTRRLAEHNSLETMMGESDSCRVERRTR